MVSTCQDQTLSRFHRTLANPIKWEFSVKVLLSLPLSERNRNAGPESYPSLTEEPDKIYENSYMPKNEVLTLLLVCEGKKIRSI